MTDGKKPAAEAWNHPDWTTAAVESLARSKADFDRAPQPITGIDIAPELFTAAELDAMVFPPVKLVVKDILTEGLTLFAGKPKVGKSWLMLHAAIAVANGGFTLGIHCPQGDVLYCALEDSKRRLQQRLRKLSTAIPQRLTFCTRMNRLADGGLDMIQRWLEAQPGAALIIIDTLAMVRDPPQREQTTYTADYQAVLALRDLAIDKRLAIVVVHHLRKLEADDPFDTVSGTLGLTGAPDAVLVISRNAGGNFTLHGKGRDLEEFAKEISFSRDACLWHLGQDADEAEQSASRSKIVAAIREADEPLGVTDIGAETGLKTNTVKLMLARLRKEKIILRTGRNKYEMRKSFS